MNSYRFQSHGLGMGKGAWATKVAVPFISYYALDLGEAIGVFIGPQNHSVWKHL